MEMIRSKSKQHTHTHTLTHTNARGGKKVLRQPEHSGESKRAKKKKAGTVRGRTEE